MLAGVIFFSLAIGSLSSLISDMDIKNTIYESKLNKLIEIRKKYKISDKMFSNIQKVLKYDIFKSDDNYVEFLESFPEGIRVELSYSIYKKTVSGLDLFENVGMDFIASICPYMKKVIFPKRHLIVNKGSYSNSMFFIIKGTVSYLLDNEEDYIPFLYVVQGNYFGEIDMIFSQKRQFKIYAHTDVELLQLDKEDYQKRLNFSFKKVANEIRERAESRRVKQIKMYEKAQKKW